MSVRTGRRRNAAHPQSVGRGGAAAAAAAVVLLLLLAGHAAGTAPLEAAGASQLQVEQLWQDIALEAADVSGRRLSRAPSRGSCQARPR